MTGNLMNPIAESLRKKVADLTVRELRDLQLATAQQQAANQLRHPESARSQPDPETKLGTLLETFKQLD